MKHPLIIAALLCSVAACSPREGVGFTGLGGEPIAVSRQQGAGSQLTGGTGYQSLTSSLVVAPTNPRRTQRQLREVFAAPSAGGDVVRLGDQTLRMNLVDVSGQRYAVLRPSGAGPVSGGASLAFTLNARLLTGCAQGGPFYGEASGMATATPLVC